MIVVVSLLLHRRDLLMRAAEEVEQWVEQVIRRTPEFHLRDEARYVVVDEFKTVLACDQPSDIRHVVVIVGGHVKRSSSGFALFDEGNDIVRDDLRGKKADLVFSAD